MKHENTKYENTKQPGGFLFRGFAFRVFAFGVFVWFVAPLCGSTIHAHEIGTTRVSVLFHEGRRYEVEIVTDAATLVEKLAAAAGESSPLDISLSGIQSQLDRFNNTFRQRVKVRFDEADDRPAIEFSVNSGDGSSSANATIRLTGGVPRGARHFTWSYGWTYASYAMTVRRVSKMSDTSGTFPVTEWLEGEQTSAPFELNASAPTIDRPGTAWRYLRLGFMHIVPNGLDHMLFVLGIYLLSGRAGSVLRQVTAFTVAHSITLGLSMYGLVTVSPRVVEPLIALSIAYVAIENVVFAELKSWRVALVFMFGLLHGMGFAGALNEVGLPRAEFAIALLTFNLGVEAGQLAVIGTAFLLVGWHCANRAWYRSRIVVPVSVLTACTSVYWTVERLVS
jgi:hydrogenase/urease accessory protein HupE